jgi:hypothetical protein
MGTILIPNVQSEIYIGDTTLYKERGMIIKPRNDLEVNRQMEG